MKVYGKVNFDDNLISNNITADIIRSKITQANIIENEIITMHSVTFIKII